MLCIDFSAWLLTGTGASTIVPKTAANKLYELAQMVRFAYMHDDEAGPMSKFKINSFERIVRVYAAKLGRNSKSRKQKAAEDGDGYPVGGIQALMDALKDGISQALAMLDGPEWTDATISKMAISFFLKTMAAAIDVSAPQGRQGGQQSLTNKQAAAFLVDVGGDVDGEVRVALSNKFKTANTFILQPITVSGNVLKLVRGYAKKVKDTMCTY
jgi:hypothetical protein